MYRFNFTAAVCLTIVLTLSIPCVSEAQIQQGRERFLHWAYQDAVDLVGQANWKTPLWILGSAGILLPASSVDESINPRMHKWNTGTVGNILNYVNECGGPRVTIPVAGIFAASLLTNNRRFQDAAFTSLQALTYAGIISYGLKYTAGRMRPPAQLGAHRFEPFSGHSSFPSGHTVAAFAILTPWVMYYPNVVTYSLFAVSTGTALARLARDKHWATDVLAGGAIGFLTAYWLSKQHLSRQYRVSVTPAIGSNVVSLRIQVNL